MRNFLYLFRNNGLPLNNRINAFDPTVSPTCTFCRIIDRETETRDSFLHFFQDCPVTSRLLEHWCNVFEPPLRFNDPSFRNFYWYGYMEDEPDGSMSLAFVVDTFKYVLWKFKKRKKIPNFPALQREIEFIISIASTLSRKIRSGIVNNNMIANFLQAQG